MPYETLCLNDCYTKFYLDKDVHTIRGISMNAIIEHDWSAGISKEQTILDCMHQGFAMCVVEPAIDRIWTYWDAKYVAYCDTLDSLYKAHEVPSL